MDIVSSREPSSSAPPPEVELCIVLLWSPSSNGGSLAVASVAANAPGAHDAGGDHGDALLCKVARVERRSEFFLLFLLLMSNISAIDCGRGFSVEFFSFYKGFYLFL